MKARRTHDAVATIGEYKDKATGEKKKIRKSIGTLFQDDQGRMSLKLDLIPTAGTGWSGFVSLYPIEGQGAAGPRQGWQSGCPAPPTTSPDDEDDDLPF